MFICPVCGKEAPTGVCPLCGFDESQNLESYPTLAVPEVLPDSIDRQAAAQGNYLRCVACGCRDFLVDTSSAQLICAGCRQAVGDWKVIRDAQPVFEANEEPAIQPPAEEISPPVEDWRRSEAAHRKWLKSLETPGTLEEPEEAPQPDPSVPDRKRSEAAHQPDPSVPDWKRSEAAHRKWLKSLENQDE